MPKECIFFDITNICAVKPFHKTIFLFNLQILLSAVRAVTAKKERWKAGSVKPQNQAIGKLHCVALELGKLLCDYVCT